MATFTFFYKIRVDLQKFSSGQEILDKWHQEAQAATEAINAGAVQVWKDAADAVVYVILTVEADNPAQAYGNALSIFGYNSCVTSSGWFLAANCCQLALN